MNSCRATDMTAWGSKCRSRCPQRRKIRGRSPGSLSSGIEGATGIEMAFNAGAFGVLVLSGETTLDVADKAPRQPDLIAENISVLGELLALSRK